MRQSSGFLARNWDEQGWGRLGYFYPPYWLLAAFLLGAVATVIHHRQLRFIDIQIWIFIAVIGFAADMLMCKQFGLYYFVAKDYKGWYSFWADLIMNPSIGLMYIKLLPRHKGYIVPYTGLWIIAILLLEIFIAVPTKIINYPRWHIFPWSIICYVLVFTAEYLYFRWLEQNLAPHPPG